MRIFYSHYTFVTVFHTLEFGELWFAYRGRLTSPVHSGFTFLHLLNSFTKLLGRTVTLLIIFLHYSSFPFIRFYL